MLHLCYMRVRKIFGSSAAALVVLLVISVYGQEPQPRPQTDPAGQPTAEERIKRWFELDTLAISTRYRVIQAANDRTSANQLQYQFAGRAHFKFDKKGKYSVHAGLFTGNVINGGWDNTGWGTGDAQSNLYLKQLYFDARPVKGLEFQIGGIAPNNGENTEITGYDNDTYLTGERIAIRNPRKLYFDEISATNGYFGDLTQPSVFRRFKHLNKSNYHQFLVRKQVNKHLSFSADYTFEAGRDFLHEAVKIKMPETHLLDDVVFENYERLDPDPGYGFGLYGEKTFHKKLTLGAGVVHIDRPSFNGDRYPPGTRLYGSAAYKISREFTIASVLIQGVGPLPLQTTPRTRFEIILTYNILETLRRTKLF